MEVGVGRVDIVKEWWGEVGSGGFSEGGERCCCW